MIFGRSKTESADPMKRIEEALRMLTVPFPHFVGLTRAVRVALDERVGTAGVFASGRMLVNPAFVAKLSDNELVFVLAHELFHLALRTHDRAVGSDPMEFNYAHDYIINDILRVELGLQKVPAGGLDWPGARRMSAEEILQEMKKDPARRPPPGTAGQGRGTPALSADALDGGTEREWFKDEKDTDRQQHAETVQQEAGKALSLGQVMAAMRGTDAGSAGQLVTALRGLYRTPWELALQRWLESVTPGDRTFVRPSRRGADRTDIVLPGRRREGWTLNIVLDTSGSMSDEIPRALGAIADFCDAVAVEQVRLLQCDTAVTSDQVMSPAMVADHEISGYGGSDLSPAMRRLADDPAVRSVIVLTDGEINYPPEEMPYEVLWVLPAHGAAGFQPPYGAVINMQSS